MRSLFVVFCFSIICCSQQKDEENYSSSTEDGYIDTTKETIKTTAKEVPFYNPGQQIETGNTTPQELLCFSETLIGIPYKYASADPSEGFDCSGFITYVFNHFNIAVPRSSAEFTNIKKEVNIEEARPGDLILFTGTDITISEVGHMGIIYEIDNKGLQFIHSSSGKANSVTVTPLNTYYMGRFVKIIRVFKQNDNP